MELLQVGQLRVLFVMAAPVEYGACLQALFRPLIQVIGQVLRIAEADGHRRDHAVPEAPQAAA